MYPTSLGSSPSSGVFQELQLSSLSLEENADVPMEEEDIEMDGVDALESLPLMATFARPRFYESVIVDEPRSSLLFQEAEVDDDGMLSSLTDELGTNMQLPW